MDTIFLGGYGRSHLCLLNVIKPRRLTKHQLQFLLPTLIIENLIYLYYKVTVSRGLSGLLIFLHSLFHSSYFHSGCQSRLFMRRINYSISGLCFLILHSLLTECTMENNRLIKVVLPLVMIVLLSSITAKVHINDLCFLQLISLSNKFHSTPIFLMIGCSIKYLAAYCLLRLLRPG